MSGGGFQPDRPWGVRRVLVASVILSLGLLVYLFYALLYPEKL